MSKYEVIIVDDGSRDDTLKKLDKYDLKIFQQDNKGLAIARNLGIKNASGQAIQFLDDDDMLGDGTLYTSLIFSGSTTSTIPKTSRKIRWSAKCPTSQRMD